MAKDVMEELPVETKVEKPEPGKKKKKKSTLKYVLNISFVLIASGLAIFLALKDDFNAIVNYIIQSDYRFLLVILGVMIGFILVRSLVLFVFARLFTREYHYHQALANYFVGVFYAAVTPGGQGGEVMQAYTYKKQGIHISCAVSALAMHSIIYQIVLILYGIVSLIVEHQFLENLPYVNLGSIGNFTVELPIWTLTILGFALNVGYIGIIFGMCYWRGLHHFVMHYIVDFLHKIRLVRDPDKTRESLRSQLENFKMEIRRLFSNVPFTILVTVLLFVSMTLFFSIPYFVGLAMNNESTCATFWDSVFLGNYHQMATGLIPVPGSAGISEFVFRSLFCAYPATPEISFYYRVASDATYINIYAQVVEDPSKFVNDFHAMQRIVDALKGMEQLEFIDLAESMRGVDYSTLSDSDAIKQFVVAIGNYRESASLASAALVMWRSITFIIPMVAAGFVTAFYRSSPKDEQVNQDNIPNRRTLVQLRNETYVERYKSAETMVETSRLTRESIIKRLRVLSRADRRKREKAKRERAKQEITDEQINEYTDVNIDDNGDDSI